MLSYYTKMYIPIIGFNLRNLNFKVNVNNAVHVQTTNNIKLICRTIIHYFIIRDFVPVNSYEYIMLTARAPPVKKVYSYIQQPLSFTSEKTGGELWHS